MNAAEFEPHIVWDVNLREVPIAALKVFVEEYEEGVPAAIAKHPEHGQINNLHFCTYRLLDDLDYLIGILYLYSFLIFGKGLVF